MTRFPMRLSGVVVGFSSHMLCEPDSGRDGPLITSDSDRILPHKDILGAHGQARSKICRPQGDWSAGLSAAGAGVVGLVPESLVSRKLGSSGTYEAEQSER